MKDTSQGEESLSSPFSIGRRIRRSGLPYAAQALLMAILDRDRFGRSEKGCTASLETLAMDIGSSRRYVLKLLPTLLASGWIIAGPRLGRIRSLRMGPTCIPDQGPIGPTLTDDQGTIGPCSGNNRVNVQGTIVPPKSKVRETEEMAGRPSARQTDGLPSLDEEPHPQMFRWFPRFVPNGRDSHGQPCNGHTKE